MALALAGWVAACSGGDDGGVVPTNRVPTIDFIFTKIGVAYNTSVNLSVDVADPDGDALTVTWAATRGAITYLNAEHTLVSWSAPNSVGVDTLTIDASDGTATTRITEVIKVGWPFVGQTALAYFEKSKSPYIVMVTPSTVLSVNGGRTIIEAGTELLLETPGTVIDVTDSLVIAGSFSEPVVIRPNVRHQLCGDDRGWWEGIKVNTVDFPPVDGHLDMNYGQIWYAQYAVRLLFQGSARVRNSVIKCSGQNGVLHEGAATLIIEDTEVSNGRLDGIAVGGPAVTLFPDSVLVDGCNITLNGRTGLALDLPDVLQEVPILVQNSNFEYNAEHAITLARAVFPRIRYNRFLANGVGSTSGLNNIWLFNGYPSGAPVTELNATCNFWGSSINNPATIAAMIRDASDTPSVTTYVDFEPWLNEYPPVTPPTCSNP